MVTFLLIISLLFVHTAFSQTFEYVYRNPDDSTKNCYLKCIPDTKVIKGLIIRDYSKLPISTEKSPFHFQSLATENNFITLYTVTSSFFPELYYNDSCAALLDEIVAEVLNEHKIPKQNIFIGGISSSGTRALRYAQYCEEGKSKYKHKVNGVFAVDPPLDLERFYISAKTHRVKFKKGMLTEAEAIVKAFPEKLGGVPSDKLEEYHRGSVYSYTHPKGGNAKYYKDIPIIIFHEPDIDWWINERGASYYDMNSFDIAGFVNELLTQGGRKIELVTTSNKGVDRQGNHNCHSWTIVDEDYLIRWIIKQLK